MPEPSTLSYVADLVVRRVLADADANTDIAQALEEAYPFDRTPYARRIWVDVLIRHAIPQIVTSDQTKSHAAG
jgi:hypothetical protein